MTKITKRNKRTGTERLKLSFKKKCQINQVSIAERQLFRNIRSKKQMPFKGAKLMKTSGYILTKQDGVALTTDLYTFDPRSVYAFAHSLQANVETVISYDHKRPFPNPDSFSIHDGTVFLCPTSYKLYSLYRVVRR